MIPPLSIRLFNCPPFVLLLFATKRFLLLRSVSSVPSDLTQLSRSKRAEHKKLNIFLVHNPILSVYTTYTCHTYRHPYMRPHHGGTQIKFYYSKCVVLEMLERNKTVLYCSEHDPESPGRLADLHVLQLFRCQVRHAASS